MNMKRKRTILFISILLVIGLIGSGIVIYQRLYAQGNRDDVITSSQINGDKVSIKVQPTTEITELEDGLSTVRYDEDYKFDDFLNQGGASSDNELVKFLSDSIFSGQVGLSYNNQFFGCSTLSVMNKQGCFFGRNFDWNKCNAMIVLSQSKGVYASISTVNMDFITSGGIDLSVLPTNVRTIAAMYAPLDGMNEKGLSVSVNMIEDSATINQNSSKPDITTTTAIRLLLNKASNVDEAVNLLSQYDMHASMNMMVHFAIADNTGKSIVVEYVDNEMIVTNTPVVTNFYLAKGDKYGIGTAQSHERYDILLKAIEKNTEMNADDVMLALDSVSKDNFDEFASTEWSIVFNQTNGEVRYAHRENYNENYCFKINE